MGMPVQEVLDLDSWRPRDNVPDPSGVDAAFDAGDTAANTAISYDVDTLLRIRFVIQQTEVTMICGDGNPTEFLIQYENNTQAAGTWIAVGAVGGGSEDVDFDSATGFADDDTTGQLLGSGTNVGGFGMEVAGASGTVTFTDEAVTECELEISVIFNGSQVANDDVINLRVLYSVLDAAPPATLVPITNSPSITMVAGPEAFTLDVTPAAVSVSGSSISMDLARTLDVTPAAVVVTGSSVNMELGFTLDVTAAAVTVTGSSIDMISAFAMVVTPAAVTITGSSISLDLGRTLDVTPVGVVITGSSITMDLVDAGDFTLDVTSAAVSITGSNIGMDRGFVLDVTPAVVTVTGSLIGLDLVSPSSSLAPYYYQTLLAGTA